MEKWTTLKWWIPKTPTENFEIAKSWVLLLCGVIIFSYGFQFKICLKKFVALKQKFPMVDQALKLEQVWHFYLTI